MTQYLVQLNILRKNNQQNIDMMPILTFFVLMIRIHLH